MQVMATVTSVLTQKVFLKSKATFSLAYLPMDTGEYEISNSLQIIAAFFPIAAYQFSFLFTNIL